MIPIFSANEEATVYSFEDYLRHQAILKRTTTATFIESIITNSSINRDSKKGSEWNEDESEKIHSHFIGFPLSFFILIILAILLLYWLSNCFFKTPQNKVIYLFDYFLSINSN